MTARAERARMLAVLRQETTDLLIDRSRSAVYLLSLAILVFGALEVWLRGPTLPSLLVVKTIQAVTVVVILVALAWRPTWWQCVALGVATVLEVCVTMVASHILAHEVASTPLLLIIVVLVTGTLLPWGLWPQLATTTIASGALAWNIALVTPPPHFGYSVVAAFLAFAASAYMAYAFERHRLAQRTAEEDVRESARELRREMQVTGTVARVSREVVAALDAPALLDRLCQLTTEAVGCAASVAYLRDATAGAFAAVAGFGEPAERFAWLRSRPIPEIALGDLLARLRQGEVVRVAAASPSDVLPLDATALLCAALRRGSDVIGFIVAAYRGAAPVVSAEQQRVLGGIARVASMTLTRSRVTEELQAASVEEAEFAARFLHELEPPLALLRELGAAAGTSGTDGVGERLRTLTDEVSATVLATLELRAVEATDVCIESIAIARWWDALGHTCASLRRRPGVRLTWTGVTGGATLAVATDPGKLRAIVRTLVAASLDRTTTGEVTVALSLDERLVVRIGDGGTADDAGDAVPFGEVLARLREARDWLGLHVARRLARQLGGSTAVEQAPGGAAVVTVDLPLRPVSTPVPRAA